MLSNHKTTINFLFTQCFQSFGLKDVCILNTLQNIIERIENKELELEKIKTLNPIYEIIPRTKTVLKEIIE